MQECRLKNILRRVEKPARYIGGETNIVRKDPEEVSVRFGFAFPDTYEIGMSYMGLQILYNILNSDENTYCERIFAPAADMEDIMRAEGMELFTLETLSPVKDMDMIGFTLQYEMSFTNVLNMLDLAGMPLRSRDRMASVPESPGHDKPYPLVVAGGPCAFNPEPLADFVDVFLIGDGEELLPRICAEYAKFKEDDGSRIDFLRSIASIDGVYVPMFYEPVYADDGTIEEMKVLDPAAPKTIKRAIVSDIASVAFPTNNIVPLIDTVHDRSVVETFRGCTRGCRFCQAGMIYRPVRERSREKVVSLASQQLQATGHDELSLLSLSTSDHSTFEPMAVELMGLCKARNVALSLPSLRLDSFSFRVLDEIQGYRKSGLTFAPEAGSQRLRDVINKNITEEDIYSATKQAIELGWNTIKLYFMIGLPTETDEDLDGIAEIARKIVDINYQVRGRKGGRFRVTVSVSNFVPKPHTPFQWVAQDTPREFIRKHDYLSERLRIKGVTFNYHESNTSSIEAVLARGDRRCGRLLESALGLGCRFDAWSEFFDEAKWERAFVESGLDPGFYTTRERSVDEILPWDHIDTFVRREYLQEEYEKATKAVVTPDCREGCTGCGMNRVTSCFVNAEPGGQAGFDASYGEDAPNAQKESLGGGETQQRSDSPASKYVITFSKNGTLCYTSHLDLMRIFKRAFKRAGIALAYSHGFNPHPRMGFAQPLSLGHIGEREYLEFETEKTQEPDAIVDALSGILPEGLEILGCKKAKGYKKTLASHTVAAEYHIRIPLSTGDAHSVPDDLRGAVPDELRRAASDDLKERYLAADEILAWKRQKKTKEFKQIDIKPMIRDISITQEDGAITVNALLDAGSQSNLSPELVVDSIIERLGLDVERDSVNITRRRILFDKSVSD